MTFNEFVLNVLSHANITPENGTIAQNYDYAVAAWDHVCVKETQNLMDHGKWSDDSAYPDAHILDLPAEGMIVLRHIEGSKHMATYMRRGFENIDFSLTAEPGDAEAVTAYVRNSAIQKVMDYVHDYVGLL